MGILLNCDLGEDESTSRTVELLGFVGAANIGCGVHAGSLAKSKETIRLAGEAGVQIGMHPGMAVAGGRGEELPSAGEFQDLLNEQCGAFLDLARSVGVRVQHIKLHGSLYSAVERDAELAAVYLEFLRQNSYLEVFSLAEGVFQARAVAAGVRVVGEIFADRGYLSSGALLPRSERGAVLSDVGYILNRMRKWLDSNEMQTSDGGAIFLNAETICVHSDSPNAIEMLRKLQRCKKS